MKASQLFLFLFITISFVSAKPFYYQNKTFSVISDDECSVTGFDPNYKPTGMVDLSIPSYASYTDSKGKVYTYKVTRISSQAFSGHDEISNLSVPATVEEIGSAAFYNCINLKACTLYPTTKKIGQNAFANCVSLAALSTCAEEIGYGAFSGCLALSAVFLGAPMKVIGGAAFSGCALLTNIDIPFTVEDLGITTSEGVFENCVSLMAVTFSYNLSDKKPRLQRIGAYAFKNCAFLEKLDFPYSVKEIGYNAFQYCFRLKHLEWGGQNKLTVYDNDLTGVPLSRIVFHGNVSLPDYYIFSRLEELEEVRFDTYATEVQNSMFRNVKSLKKVHLDKVEKIGNSSFYGCTSLNDLTLSKELELIDYYAFKNCITLNKIDIPVNVKTINDYAFEDCRRLKEVSLKEGLETISGYVFRGCHDLEELIVPMSVSSFGPTALDSCLSLKKLTIGGGIQLNSSYYYIAKQSPLKDLVLRGKVSANFSYSNYLETVKCTNYCDEIFSLQFNNDTNLKEVDLGNVKKIGSSAFAHCTNLQSIDLSKVEEIGSGAFDYSGLRTLTVPDRVTQLYMPNYCANLESVTLGDGITHVQGFTGCNALKTIHMGRNTSYVYISPTSVRRIECANPTPPTAGSFTWDVYDNAELVVPTGASSAYKNTAVWTNFKKITETDFAGISDVEKDDSGSGFIVRNGFIEALSDSPVSIYTVEGKFIQTITKNNDATPLQKGMYVVKVKNKADKILVN